MSKKIVRGKWRKLWKVFLNIIFFSRIIRREKSMLFWVKTIMCWAIFSLLKRNLSGWKILLWLWERDEIFSDLFSFPWYFPSSLKKLIKIINVIQTWLRTYRDAEVYTTGKISATLMFFSSQRITLRSQERFLLTPKNISLHDTWYTLNKWFLILMLNRLINFILTAPFHPKNSLMMLL